MVKTERMQWCHEAVAPGVGEAFIEAGHRRLRSVKPFALEEILATETVHRKIGARVGIVAFETLPAMLCGRRLRRGQHAHSYYGRHGALLRPTAAKL